MRLALRILIFAIVLNALAARSESAIEIGQSVVLLQTTSWHHEGDSPGVVSTLRTGTVLPVERIENRFLWLRSTAGAGWMSRDKVADLTTGARVFSDWIQRGISPATAYYGRGNVRQAEGNLPAAIADYSESIRLNPSYAEAWRERGKSKLLQSSLNEAISDLSESIRLDNGTNAASDSHDLLSSFYHRGLARSLKNELTEAIADFDEAIRRNPRYALAYNRRGLTRALLGDHRAAIADFDKAIESSPSFAAPHNFRGQSLEALGRFAEALADYEKAVKLAPETVFVVNSPSHALYKTLDPTAPIPVEISRQLIPTFSPPNNLARLLVTCPDEKLRNPQRALWLVEFLRTYDHRRYFEFLDTEAVVEAALGNRQKAAELQNLAAQLAPPERRAALLIRSAEYMAAASE